jgi:outer membrane immunogenic protein
MKTAFIAAAVLAAVAGSALAADIPPPRMSAKAPATVHPVATWTGCYLGVGGGYGMWNQDHTTVVDGTGVLASGEITTGGRGWFGTAQVGCDYQWGESWVLGAFGDYDFANMKGSFTEPVFNVIGREKLAWQWAAGGRVGYLIQPQLLGFFSAGYTQANFEQITLGPAGAANTHQFLSNTYDGWFLGSGYEYRLAWLWPGLTWKTEYRFSQFQRDRLQLQTIGGAPTGFAMDSNIYEQSIRSELVFRFDGWR